MRSAADAAATVAALKAEHLRVLLLSGDHAEAVERAARRTGIDEWRAHCLPTDKAGALAFLRGGGKRVLMVGDGINDAPALAAADVSMSPASASDISQTAASLVFTGARLEPVLTALCGGARRAAADPAEHRPRRRLQRLRRAGRHARPRDAVDRRRRHVDVVDRRHRQCAPPVARLPRWEAHDSRAGRVVAPGAGMTAILILIPAALFLGGLGLFAFLWSLRSGQYDDLDGAAVRILSDDAPPGERNPKQRAD